jgi:hypothetical protein
MVCQPAEEAERRNTSISIDADRNEANHALQTGVFHFLPLTDALGALFLAAHAAPWDRQVKRG